MGSPALMDAQARQILGFLEELRGKTMTFVQQGGIVADNSSAQLAGVSGALTVNVDWDLIIANVRGEGHQLAAASGSNLYNAAFAWGAETGVQTVAAVVLKTGADNDTPAADIVFGTVAATGSAVAPTDAEILAAMTGYTYDNWVRLCDVTITRTGATAITLTFDHSVRAMTTGFQSAFSVSESDYRL